MAREITTPDTRNTNSDARQLISALKEAGGGSLLRGWRCELDPDGKLEVGYQEFCAACARLRLTGDLEALLGGDGEYRSLSLGELAPYSAALVERFRSFMKHNYESPKDLFTQLDIKKAERIDNDVFMSSCKKLGFASSDQDLGELFSCCDVDNVETIGWEELAFLESDPHLRELQQLQIKRGRRERHRRLWADTYVTEIERMSSPLDRHAPRPWLASTFEQLPAVTYQRQADWRHEVRCRKAKAREEFMGQLRKSFGNEIRAWRLALDPGGTFKVSHDELSQYCRRVNFCRFPELWKALDRDGDGYLRLEDLSPKAALVLVGFQRWAHEGFGSCANVWDQPEVERARRARDQNGHWASEKRMRNKAFLRAIRSLGWSGVVDNDERAILIASLDVCGAAAVSRADLSWLDGWQPPAWVSAKPNLPAWVKLRAMMLKECKTLLRAWRQLLDKDDSNSISWKEFTRACDHLGFKGDTAGAWRALDVDLSGLITMREFDAESAELLASFRHMCEQNFGSTRLALKAFGGSGQITLAQMKRACQRLRWKGDVQSLFDFLEFEERSTSTNQEDMMESLGKKSLSLDVAAFLDNWANVDREEKESMGENLKSLTGNDPQSVSISFSRSATPSGSRGSRWSFSQATSTGAKAHKGLAKCSMTDKGTDGLSRATTAPDSLLSLASVSTASTGMDLLSRPGSMRRAVGSQLAAPYVFVPGCSCHDCKFDGGAPRALLAPMKGAGSASSHILSGILPDLEKPAKPSVAAALTVAICGTAPVGDAARVGVAQNSGGRHCDPPSSLALKRVAATTASAALTALKSMPTTTIN